MTDTRNGQAVLSGPSDREIVSQLQRLASAQAQLLQAESAASSAGQYQVDAGQRNHEIEDAHAELLWAQAQLLTAQREHRAQRTLEQAKERENQVLRRYGFTNFREYLTDRTSVPTNDIHLEVARREYEAAQHGWNVIQHTLQTGPVIDLTGRGPRRIA